MVYSVFGLFVYYKKNTFDKKLILNIEKYIIQDSILTDLIADN